MTIMLKTQQKSNNFAIATLRIQEKRNVTWSKDIENEYNDA